VRQPQPEIQGRAQAAGAHIAPSQQIVAPGALVEQVQPLEEGQILILLC